MFELNQPVKIKSLPYLNTISFYADVSHLPQGKYEACLHFESSSPALSARSFKLFASNTHYYPNPLDPLSYESVSEPGKFFNNKWRYCV